MTNASRYASSAGTLLAMACLLAACGGAAAPASSASSAQPAASSAAKPAGSAAASGSAVAAGLRKVTLAWATPTSVFLVPQVGIQSGIFQKHGIDLNLIYTGSGPTAIASLISGDVQFIELADPSVTTSALKGSGVQWVAVSVPRPNLALWVHPTINAVSDLKGKKVGVTTLGSLTALMGQYVLQQNGLDPKKDVQLIAIGGGLEAQSAIVNNQVDAIVTAPDTPLPGQKILVNLSTAFEFPQGGLVTTKNLIQKDPQLVQDMVTAFTESIRRFKTDRATTYQIDQKELQRSNPDDAKKEVDGVIDVLANDVTPTPKGFENELGMLADSEPTAKTAKPTDFFDDRFGKVAAQQAAK